MRARDLQHLEDLFVMARYAGGNLQEALLVVLQAEEARRHESAAGFAKAHTTLRRIGKGATVELKRKAAALYPIVAEVAAEHGIPVEHVAGGMRGKEVSLVREEAMWKCRRVLAASFPVIAAATGCWNHTSVIAGVRRFEARLAADPKLRARVLGERQLRSVA